MTQQSGVRDPIDAAIVAALRDDGRQSWRRLGEAVHLAPTSVADRVRRLEGVGVILGYTARIDHAAMGLSVRALIEVVLAPGDHAGEFGRRAATRHEVTFAAYVTGRSDYALLVACAGTDELDRFVRWLRADPAVAATETSLLMRIVVDSAG